jgi:hypothetical protein
MAKVLSRYSQTKSLEQQTTQQGIVDSNTIGDLNQPYSFMEWVFRNTGIIPGQDRKQYNSYLSNWYVSRNLKQAQEKQQVRDDYIAMLQQLSLVFRDDAEKSFAVDIDWTNELEVEQVIPFYSRKLKEIAIYIINKRDVVKRAKLKYNLAGAKISIEKLFYEYLLKAFTKKRFPGNEYLTNVAEVSTLALIPELSAVAGSFQIQIDELYDSTSYFDKSPSVPISAYYNLTDTSTVDYLTGTIGIDTKDFEWLYETGVSKLCADNPLFWVIDDVLSQYKNGIPLSALEVYDSVILNDYNRIALAAKYLGESQYIISGGYYLPALQDTQFNLTQGNNWFYWTSGEYMHENDTTQSVLPIMLTATNLIQDGATAGVDYKSADVIFTRRGDTLSGAWLQSKSHKTISPIMSARLVKGRTLFNFPYPGYGLSGEDLDWSGRSFDNLDVNFYYLDTNVQSEILKLYWSTSTDPVSVFNPLSIHNANLIDSGAIAGKVWGDADQITIRYDGIHDITPDSVYTGAQYYAWLYKMEKTDLPISIGSNNLYWPFNRYTTTITTIAPSSQCIPICLSGINIGENMLGAVAGTNLSQADKIYKLNGTSDLTKSQGAWLSGSPATSTTITLISCASQSGLTFYTACSSTPIFLWEGNNTQADNILTHYNHQKDCDYNSEKLISLYTNKIEQADAGVDYNQWKKCSCKSIYYSPLGHPGSKIDDYNRLCDMIYTVRNPLSSFSFETWKDIDNNLYNNSSEFGWYQLTGSQLEPDVGWGSGRWLTTNGENFILSSGMLYMYVRSNLNRESVTDSPYFVAKYNYNNNNQQWVGMYYDTNLSKWLSTNESSNIVLLPGDTYFYDHATTNSYSVTGSRTIITEKIVYQLPDFSRGAMTSNIVTSGYNTITMYISTPLYANTGSATTGNFITGWIVTPVEYPDYTEGTPLTVSGSFTNMTQWELSSTVSAVYTQEYFDVPISLESINFMINVPLSGWNYTTNMYDGSSYGARPFWAQGTDDGTVRDTKCKGIDIWGGNANIVDYYNIQTQPILSNIVLDVDTYIDYNRVNNTPLVWKQPLEFTNETIEKKWCNLVFNTNETSNLSANLYNNIRELVAFGTDDVSKIELNLVENEPLVINYYAMNPFTWTQTLTNTTLGVPPTGGNWSPIISGDLITPTAPYANLTNRHFPTIASVPYVGNLFSMNDSGGYYIPQMLGVTTFLSKHRTQILDTKNVLDSDPTKRGLTRIFQDPVNYTSDYGLTNTMQVTPISTLMVNSDWMKAAITDWEKAGMIVNARQHQEFMPYQTEYESKGSNSNGVHRQGDGYDPWYTNTDNVWENTVDWPANWRKQYDIQGWYNQSMPANYQAYKWKTDVFSNQYTLLKDIRSKSIYDKRNEPGFIWTRDLANIIRPATESMKEVYDNFIALDSTTSSLLSTSILDFEIWFDMLMIRVPNILLFAKIQFDYDNNRIYSIADNIHRIYLCNGKFGDTWFHEEDKYVTICTLLSSSINNSIYYYPKLYELDLETNIMKIAYNGNNVTDYTTLTSLSLSSVEDPVFTYNIETKVYNIAFIGHSTTREGMYFTTININHFGDTYNLQSYRVITPTM